MSRLARVVAVCGLALIVAGVSIIFWPAGIIAAGIALVTVGLTDFEE